MKQQDPQKYKSSSVSPAPFTMKGYGCELFVMDFKTTMDLKKDRKCWFMFCRRMLSILLLTPQQYVLLCQAVGLV